MGRRTEQGSSLPEILVAAALLVILLAPLAGLFGTSRNTALDSGRRAAAVSLARTWLERFLAWNSQEIAAYLEDPAHGFELEIRDDGSLYYERPYTQDPDRPYFDVRVEVEIRLLRAPLPDDIMPEQLNLSHITVTVRWTDKGSPATVQLATTMHAR